MKAALEINGKTFVPVKQAAEYFNYSRDHLTRLAKTKKVEATQLGRLWYVNQLSVENYLEDQKVEAEVRKQMLSKQRQTELQLRNAMATAHSSHADRSQKSAKLAVVFACLFFGVLFAAASQIVPTFSVSVASLGWSTSDIQNTPEDVQAAKPVFTDDNKVLVSNPDRWVDKPEVTSQWVTITP